MNNQRELKFLTGYPEQLTVPVQKMISEKRLAAAVLKRFPSAHEIKNERALYDFTIDLKNRYFRNAPPISKVTYDSKINVLHDALGLHTFISRVQGGKLKSKNEIRIGSVFKTASEDFLRMIVIHELAHLKEKEHNKSFYRLCVHMEPNYHQLEFDLRVYLTCIDIFGPIY